MSDEEYEDEKDLSQRGDAAHPFDQTNGMAEGLEGDADDPEQVDKRTGDGTGGAFLAAPSPGTQMAGGVFPAVAREQADGDDEIDDPDSSAP